MVAVMYSLEPELYANLFFPEAANPQLEEKKGDEGTDQGN